MNFGVGEPGKLGSFVEIVCVRSNGLIYFPLSFVANQLDELIQRLNILIQKLQHANCLHSS